MKTILAAAETISLIFYYFTPRLSKQAAGMAPGENPNKPKPDIALTITH